MRYVAFLLSICCVSLLHQQRANSQNFGNTTTNGLFGQRNVTAPTGNVGSAFGGSFGSDLGGQQGFGQGFGQQGFGQGQQGFGQQGQQGFLGAGVPEVDLFSRAQNQQAGNFDVGLQGLLSRAAQRDFQNQDGGGSSQIELRSRITLGFQSRGLSPAVFNDRMTYRLEKLPLGIVDHVEVSLVERTAVVRGRVASDHDANMVAQILLLEPGVDSVQNNLNVGVEPSPTFTPPAPDSPVAPPNTNDSSVIPIPPPIPEGVLLHDPVPPSAPTAPGADE